MRDQNAWQFMSAQLKIIFIMKNSVARHSIRIYTNASNEISVTSRTIFIKEIMKIIPSVQRNFIIVEFEISKYSIASEVKFISRCNVFSRFAPNGRTTITANYEFGRSLGNVGVAANPVKLISINMLTEARESGGRQGLRLHFRKFCTP